MKEILKDVSLQLLKSVPPHYAINPYNAEKVCNIARYFERPNEESEFYDINIRLVAYADIFPRSVSLMISAASIEINDIIEFTKMLALNAVSAEFHPYIKGNGDDGKVILSVSVDDVYYFMSDNEEEINGEANRLNQHAFDIISRFMDDMDFSEDDTGNDEDI